MGYDIAYLDKRIGVLLDSVAFSLFHVDGGQVFTTIEYMETLGHFHCMSLEPGLERPLRCKYHQITYK